jgi:HEAT repeat protein
LKECLPVIQDPKIRLAIENAIGKFGNADSFELLKQILESKDASYHEQQASAIAIARTGKEQSLPILQKLVDTTTFRNIVAQGAIDGLKIVALDSKDNRIINNIEDLLINKTRYGNESRLRRAAASALGYLGKNRKGEIKNVECLKGLLNDESVHVRNTACAALGNALENTRDLSALAELKRLAEHDPDGQVRITAKEAIDIIEGNEKAKEDVPTKVGEADRIDSKYKSKKIELMEKRIPGK